MIKDHDLGHTPKIVSLVPGEKSVNSELRASVEDYEREAPYLERHYKARAYLYRVFFLSLVSQGFTEEQAVSMTESEFLN